MHTCQFDLIYRTNVFARYGLVGVGGNKSGNYLEVDKCRKQVNTVITLNRPILTPYDSEGHLTLRSWWRFDCYRPQPEAMLLVPMSESNRFHYGSELWRDDQIHRRKLTPLSDLTH